MKKLILFLVLFFFFLPTKISAHVLQTDKDIGVIMHITPDDDPVAGKISEIFLDFKNTDGKFDAKNCECSVSITTAESNLFYSKIFTNPKSDSESVIVPITFPEKAVYKIEVAGKPKERNTFQPFNISFDVRVSKDTLDKPSYTSYVAYLPIAVAVLFGIIIFVVFTNSKKK
jgi:hypothetical protein